MKKSSIFAFAAGVFLLSTMVSCNYEDLNTNQFEVSEEQGKMDGISLGGSITLMQRSVVPVGTQANNTDIINKYQTAYHLAADSWSGYFGQDNTWNSGNNNTTYWLMDAWVSSSYTAAYTDIKPSWTKVRVRTEETDQPEVYALAQIFKVSAWHKALEMFGPIPYIHADELVTDIPCDTQEEVYDAMFTDLQTSIEVLTPLAGARLMENFDIIYGGDVNKWLKYSRSLMLRLAMRLKYVAPDKAKQWASIAYGGSSANLICTVDDEAKVVKGAAGYDFINNINGCANQYNETKMSSSMFAYLNGYHDPRLSKYFTPATAPGYTYVEGYDGSYYGPVPTGTYYTTGSFADASKPNVTADTPTYWMRASEVCFLLAEAALEWPAEFGQPEDWYRKGIETSFEENGLATSAVASYMNDTYSPQNIKLSWYSAPQPTTATTNFTAATSRDKELALEKIMIQKWIALYPNGQEAWTEWRRTGYPRLNPVQNNNGALRDGVRRMPYPSTCFASEESRQDALQKLGGTDDANTRLWWDCK